MRETKAKVIKRARVIIAIHRTACPYFKRRRLTRADALLLSRVLHRNVSDLLGADQVFRH